jgi:hypothetical protein
MNRHWRILNLAIAALAFVSLLIPTARADDATPTMPLADIQPGMTGEWHTVVSGTRIDSFPMRVVGIADDFIGPQRPVIICEGLDAANVKTGPVAGMSGSPVFINGKLIGAYAYGFLFPHDQDLFGVTPIDQMMEVEKYPPAANPWGGNETAQASNGGEPQWLVAPTAGVNLPSPSVLQSAMKPLPTPLFVSGVSEQVLKKFEPQLERLGVQVMQAPSGSSGTLTNTDLVPGAAVSGVLMSGDFQFAGTGTVTWRDGNRILAFGHPFMQSGPTEMPMASAEILTVVSSWMESFKLLNVGSVVGTIYQDRLTAIAGEIGRKARTTHVEIHVSAPDGTERMFQGEMFQDRDFSPILTAIALLESFYATMESEQKHTIYLDTDLEIDGHAPVKLSDVGTDENGGFDLAMHQMELYGQLLSNPCEFPQVKSLVFHARLVNANQWSRLDSLNIDRDEVKPGAMLHAVIGLRNYRSEPSFIPVLVPIPGDVRANKLELFVGDADAASDRDELPDVPPQTLDQVLARLRLTRSHQNICVKLLESAPGISVEGQNLPDLPPSVLAQFDSPNASLHKATLSHITIWETNFPAAGTFSGQITLPVSIK